MHCTAMRDPANVDTNGFTAVNVYIKYGKGGQVWVLVVEV